MIIPRCMLLTCSLPGRRPGHHQTRGGSQGGERAGIRAPRRTGTVTWELRQTYDAVTLAPYGYSSTSSNGGYRRLTDRHSG